MLVINIEVLRKEDNVIQVRISVIRSFQHNKFSPDKLEIMSNTFSEWKDKIFKHQIILDCDAHDKLYTPRLNQITRFYLDTESQKNERPSYYHEVAYDLPTTPHLAILWVVNLVEYISNLQDRFGPFFIKFAQDKPFVPLMQPASEQSFQRIAVEGKDVIPDLFTQLLALQPLLPQPNPYQEALRQIGLLYNFYQQNCRGKDAIKLSQCFNFDNIFMFFDQEPFKQITALAATAAAKEPLIQLMKQCIKEGRKDELTYFLRILETSYKAKLYRLCLKEKAPDNIPYVWERTEWYFWVNARLFLRQDERAEITLVGNRGYDECYAFGKKNYSIFEGEIRHMGKIMGLEFEPGDLHKGIICTLASTERLKEQGLLFFSLFNFKKMLYAYNKINTSYKEYSASGELSDFWLMKSLPPEMREQIENHVADSFEKGYRNTFFKSPNAKDDEQKEIAVDIKLTIKEESSIPKIS